MSVLQKITDILYPPTCAFCGKKADIYRTLCRDCYAEFVREKVEKCPICGKTAKDCECGCDFTVHTKTEIADRRFLTLTFYKSKRTLGMAENENRLTERMIYRLKEQCAFTEFFAAELTREINKLFGKSCEDIAEWTMTYAPRSEENLVKYGFDQSEEVARKTAKKLGIPCVKTVLRDSGDVQKKLNVQERLANAEDSIYVNGSKIEKGGKYLLFDDIITSGATVMTVSRNLYFHGAAKVFPISIARTMPSADVIKNDDTLSEAHMRRYNEEK